MKTITYSETLWVTIDNALRSDPWRDVPGAAEAGGKLTLHFGPWWPDFALTIGQEPETIEFDDTAAAAIEQVAAAVGSVLPGEALADA